MLRQAISRGRDTPRYCAASNPPRLRRPRSSPTLPSSPASRRTARKTRSRSRSPSAARTGFRSVPDVVGQRDASTDKGGRPGALHRLQLRGREPDLLEADDRLANGRAQWRATAPTPSSAIMRFRERKKLVEAMRSPPVEETALGLREPDGATVAGPAGQELEEFAAQFKARLLQPCPDNSPLACGERGSHSGARRRGAESHAVRRRLGFALGSPE